MRLFFTQLDIFLFSSLSLAKTVKSHTHIVIISRRDIGDESANQFAELNGGWLNDISGLIDDGLIIVIETELNFR